MPQVITDSSLNPGIVSDGGTDIFGYPDNTVPSILSLQTVSTQPLPPGTGTATGLLTPPLQLRHHLANFSPEVYDLSPTSVITHFMQAVLGDSGAGQMRRRQLVARLQSALSSTRFFDLDSFYGALFGCTRGPSGTLPGNPATGLPVNPYTDLASPDGWDEIEAIDARFRERIIALARAITLGGTVAGLRALGEAISGVPCQVYETWRLDAAGTGTPPVTWHDVETQHPRWNTFGSITWQQLQGITAYSGMGIGAPNEVIIQPRKHYEPSQAGLQQQGADLFGILSVAEVLQPASALVTVDVNGPAIVRPVQPSGIWSDSNYWEVTHLVTPASAADPAYAAARSAYQAGGQPPGMTFQQPRPAMARGHGGQYSCVSDITTVTAQAVSGGEITDTLDYETVFFATGQTDYLPPRAVMTPARAASARIASATSMQCAPYTGPRIPVKTAT